MFRAVRTKGLATGHNEKGCKAPLRLCSSSEGRPRLECETGGGEGPVPVVSGRTPGTNERRACEPRMPREVTLDVRQVASSDRGRAEREEDRGRGAELAGSIAWRRVRGAGSCTPPHVLPALRRRSEACWPVPGRW